MLTLHLKTKWFQLIKDGTKRAEYRDITPYYCARLCAKYNPNNLECRHCETSRCQPTPKVQSIHFVLGYPKTDDSERHLTRHVIGIVKAHGLTLLGANPTKKQFVIVLP